MADGMDGPSLLQPKGKAHLLFLVNAAFGTELGGLEVPSHFIF